MAASDWTPVGSDVPALPTPPFTCHPAVDGGELRPSGYRYRVAADGAATRSYADPLEDTVGSDDHFTWSAGLDFFKLRRVAEHLPDGFRFYPLTEVPGFGTLYLRTYLRTDVPGSDGGSLYQQQLGAMVLLNCDRD